MEPGSKLRNASLLRCLAGTAAAFLLAALLIAPLFNTEYLANWASIDSTFIADTRFLIAHWPHPLWQPLWYGGTRFDYIYPPALRYGTASLAILADLSAARAYHLYTAILYCTGIAGVYAFLRTVRGSPVWAAVAAAAAATLSPSFLLMPAYRDDSALHMPQRLNVLVKWGEGPHVSALCLLPFALLFSWRALHRRDSSSLALAALFSALVVAHNFYGATALAALFGILVFSVWIAHRGWTIPARAAGIGLLAFGFSAFWLTPSYVRLTLQNLRFVAQPGTVWSYCLALLAAALFAWAGWRIGRRHDNRAYAIFLCGSTLLFGLVVAGHYYLGFRVLGEPHRFVPELDLVLILAAVEGLRIIAGRGGWWKYSVSIAVAACFATSLPYLAGAWSVLESGRDHRTLPEYRVSEWASRRLPGSRIFLNGTFRFWHNAWFDNPQVGGGSDQGLGNDTLALAQWQVIKDQRPGRDIAWLQAVGANAIVVPDPSHTAFPDYPAPRKFAGLLPVLYRDSQGNVAYQVPRRFPSLARIVRTAELAPLSPIPVSNENGSDLDAYVRALEQGPDRPVELRRDGPETISLRATLLHGESIVVQESYDPAWRAYSGPRDVPIHRDPAGFMRLDAQPGNQSIRLIFELPLENKLGRVVTALAIAIAGFLLLRRTRLSP